MAVTGAPELLIVMGANATPDQVDDVVARLEEAGCGAVVTPGREATVIGAIGERELLAALPLEGYAGVEQVLPILKPYKLVSRELSPDPTVIESRGRRIGDGYFGFIAGPCSVETRETSTRFTLDIGAIPVLKQETHLPVIVDPSHPAGRRDLVLPLARAAVAAGADGIIVETHPRPEEALSDGPQQIPTAEFPEFAAEIRALASLMGRTIG